MFSSARVTSNDTEDTSLRGFLAIFDLAQILNLVWIWFKTQYVVVILIFDFICSHNVGD
jgi:hypothetical protein